MSAIDFIIERLEKAKAEGDLEMVAHLEDRLTELLANER